MNIFFASMQTYKHLVTIFAFLLGVVGIVFIYFNSQVKEQKLDSVLDQCNVALEHKLKNEQMNALEIALVLSKNEGLVNALENEDEELGYEILSDIMRTIKSNTDRYIRAQVITAEYNIFARSWDDVYAGMPLGDYRQDLLYIEKSKAPRTSIEIGRRLGIKATVPVYMKETLIGFVEVIDFFESMTNYFRGMGIDLYVMLDIKHFEQAVLMQENLIVNQHIVSNINYNFSHIQTLNAIDFKRLKANKVVEKDDKYIFYKTMYDGNHEAIGAFLFVLPKKYLEYFRDPEDDISFLINVTRSGLYDVEKERTYKTNAYDRYSAESLLYIKDIVAKEDRELFLDEAYKRLDSYTKDELIELMLEHKLVRKIDGKIKWRFYY